MTLCACGCGGEIVIKPHHKYYGIPSVISGHHTEETRKKIAAANTGHPSSKKGQPSGRKGMPYPEAAKNKISKANKGKTCGNKNGNWHGGTSYLPYCQKWTAELREAVRERDGHICQLCGLKQTSLIRYHKKLAVHHIHYDKENCYPDLITLCRSDNSKVNFNRKHYEELFMNKLNDRELLFWTLSLYKEKTV